MDALFTKFQAFGIQGFIDTVRVEQQAVARIELEGEILCDALKDGAFINADG